MIRSIKILFLSVFLVAISGCVYLDVNAPGAVYSATSYQLNSDDFKVLGRVETTGVTTGWFGVYLAGGQGYQDLLKQAQNLGGDAIMNYSFDVHQKSILFFVYQKLQWKATGLAVKLSDDIKAEPVESEQ